MSELKLSVILPTRNPHPERLNRVLAGLRQQTLAPSQWEFWVIDNGSEPPLHATAFADFPVSVRILPERRPGLFWARLTGLQAAAGQFIVFLDDDTVPAPGSLASIVRFMEANAKLGTAGGRIEAEYLRPPPPWIGEVEWALALRNWGDQPRVWQAGDTVTLPNWTPIGAGLVVRRTAVPDYLEHARRWSDAIIARSWHGQGSGGNEDKDLVLCLLRAGWATGYCPEHRLTHLIPESRLSLRYFEQLLPVLGELWERTLYAYRWEFEAPIHPATQSLRACKAWWTMRAWRGPAERLRWLSKRGSYAGRARNYRERFRYPAGSYTPLPAPC
ncbi:MAG TPA: glycosyltransferase [Opitutus sp.]|nr:glycosyltransferase [Opitutus sp.]